MKFLSKLSIWDKINLVVIPTLAYFAIEDGDWIAGTLATVGVLFFNDFALLKLIASKVKK